MSNAFSLMFASEPKERHPIVFPGVASVKLDGIRSATKWGRTWTRSSKEAPNPFTRERLNLCEGLDGEFILGKPNVPEVFDLSTSAFRRGYGEPDFRIYAFDHIQSTDKQEDILEARLERLAAAVPMWNERIRNTFGDTVDRIILLPQKLVHNMEELLEFYAEALEMGFEGLIYKRCGMLYKHGRATSLSQEQLKMKPLEDSEAVVLELIEGSTNLNLPFINERGLQERSSHKANKVPSGMLGKIRCRDIYSGVEFLCSPGRMPHDMRVAALSDKSQCTLKVGSVFTYLYFPIGVYEKPRMNRFKGVRSIVDIDRAKALYIEKAKTP